VSQLFFYFGVFFIKCFVGLGKTAQLCVHFNSLSKLHVNQQHTTPSSSSAAGAKSTSNAMFLVVCPATVLHHWLKEMHSWAPTLRAMVLHSISRTGAELLKLGDAGESSILNVIFQYSYLPFIGTLRSGISSSKAATWQEQ